MSSHRVRRPFGPVSNRTHSLLAVRTTPYSLVLTLDHAREDRLRCRPPFAGECVAGPRSLYPSGPEDRVSSLTSSRAGAVLRVCAQPSSQLPENTLFSGNSRWCTGGAADPFGGADVASTATSSGRQREAAAHVRSPARLRHRSGPVRAARAGELGRLLQLTLRSPAGRPGSPAGSREAARPARQWTTAGDRRHRFRPAQTPTCRRRLNDT